MTAEGDSLTAAREADNELVLRSMDQDTDLDAICAINEAAFAEHGRTKAFDQFRQERDDILSLVATVDGEMIGHVLFSPAAIETPQGNVTGMGLGQLAIAPEWQRQGVGAQITEAGISKLREQDCPFIIVVGHASYYPRFGFEPGSLHGVTCQWENIPDDSFMVLFLDERQKGRLRGVASFDGM